MFYAVEIWIIQIQHLLKLNFTSVIIFLNAFPYSNTTLVKVKLFIPRFRLYLCRIQIQHLLKLNASKINTFINNYSL